LILFFLPHNSNNFADNFKTGKTFLNNEQEHFAKGLHTVLYMQAESVRRSTGQAPRIWWRASEKVGALRSDHIRASRKVPRVWKVRGARASGGRSAGKGFRPKESHEAVRLVGRGLPKSIL
jgi:hypothetical protein